MVYIEILHISGVANDMIVNRPSPYLLASPDDDVKLVKHWLEDCVDHHSACRAAHKAFLPTRLIKVNAFENSIDVKLIETEILTDLNDDHLYTTLSHRWGSEPSVQPPQTRTNNYDKHCDRIVYDSLSLSFQDAIRITRDLGIHYLWIDSLCILQDSLADWEKEASLMGQVYAGSCCTFTAASSSNGLEGCRRRFQNTGFTMAPRSVDLDFGSMQVKIFEHSPLDWNWELKRTSLQRRAWTLQERKLSTRVVHYCDNLLLWECQSLKASSELPWFQVNTDDQAPFLLLNSPKDLRPKSSSLLRRELWFDMIQDYSSRGLKKHRDRLPALEGLAQREMEPSRGRYLAGLWESDLPSALLWHVSWDLPECEVVRPCTYRAPSWSWASVEGPVTYESQRSWQTMIPDEERIALECNFGRFKLKEVSVEQRNLQILSGSLHVSGDIMPVTADPRSFPQNKFTNIQSPMGATIGILYPDIVSTISAQDHLVFLRIRDEAGRSRIQLPHNVFAKIQRAGYASEPMCMGLGLRSQPGGENCYQRVGLIRYARQLSLTAAATRSIVIY